MGEIEKHYNGEIHVDFDDDSLTYKELEELLYYWLDKYKEKELETKKLHSIIKEVREYIIKQVHRNQQFYEMDIDNVLEILDKGE